MSTTSPDRSRPLHPEPADAQTPSIAWSAATLTVTIASLTGLAIYSQTTEGGQRRDQAAMKAIDADTDTVRELLSWLGYVSIGTTAIALLICIALALVRHRYAAAAGAAALVVGSNVTTQILKRFVIDRPDYGYLSVPSLPSGHTTVVISVVLAALLIAPRGLRFAITLLGSILVTLAGTSTVVAGWHRPSDILAALLVALTWGALVVLVLSLRRAPRVPSGAPTHLVLSLCGSAAAGLLLVFLGVRPGNGWTGVGDAALLLGGLGLACAATVSIFARLSATHSA